MKGNLPEQELSVQVGDFDIVIISAGEFTLNTAAETGKSELFDEFTSKSTSSDQEEPIS